MIFNTAKNQVWNVVHAQGHPEYVTLVGRNASNRNYIPDRHQSKRHMGQPNILFLIWDSCRVDSARRCASTLSDLGLSGHSFSNAIAPATWSLPSHASLFTGQQPHEHGRVCLTDDLTTVDLPARLSERGYTTYGVSANGFASFKTGFADGFDEFWYTGGEEPYTEGLGVYEFVHRRRRTHPDATTRQLMAALASSLVTHKHPFKSTVNLAATVAGKAARRFEPLQRIPHTIFAANNSYSYHPAKNTTTIEHVLEREARTDRPFFLFANYMDPHRPYRPEGYLDGEGGQSAARATVERLNDNIADPWQFIRAVETDHPDPDPDDIETLRQFYADEVRRADRELSRLLARLRQLNLFEETIIVVTADHGENLGETDEMGRQRFGHEASISDALVRVPLVVHYPTLSGETVEKYVSLTDLYNLFTAEALGDALDKGRLPDVFATDGPVTAQYPAVGGEELYEKYPDVPKDTLAHRVERHSVAGYVSGYRLVVESDGTERAWADGKKVPVKTVPDELYERCRANIDELATRDASHESLTQSERDRLEALGYL